MAPVFPAFLVAFGCFGAFLLDVRRQSGPSANPFAFAQRWPPWAVGVLIVVFLYAGANFLLFFQATGGGTLEYHGAQAYLSNHGTVIRALDASGVRAFHVWEVRLFTGHILPFLVLPGLYFWLRARPESASGKSQPLSNRDEG